MNFHDLNSNPQHKVPNSYHRYLLYFIAVVEYYLHPPTHRFAVKINIIIFAFFVAVALSGSLLKNYLSIYINCPE